MGLFKSTLAALIILAAPVAADPLAQMAGSWRGDGWARETPQGPQEAIRCQLDNSYDVQTLTLTVKGRCAVPGRKLTMAGMITAKKGSDQITGRWFNPDGVGSVRLSGIKRADLIAFTFAAKDPDTGRNLAQNVEWRLDPASLRLRATDRDAPDVMMSDIVFKR